MKARKFCLDEIHYNTDPAIVRSNGKNAVKKLLVVILLCSTGALAQAQTLYVSDQLEVTLRRGQSTSHGILRMLPSGAPVVLLESNSESGYSRVRTANGVEGWVLTRYLMDTPSGRERVATAEKKLADLQQEYRAFKEQLSRAGQEKGALVVERQRLEGENRTLTQQLAEIRRTSSNVLAVDEENKSLKGRVLGLERELQTIQQENAALKNRSARDWFMIGAGVLLLGIVVGLVLPKIRVRKQSRWDTL